jgi:Manganese containing catalase
MANHVPDTGCCHALPYAQEGPGSHKILKGDWGWALRFNLSNVAALLERCPPQLIPHEDPLKGAHMFLRQRKLQYSARPDSPDPLFAKMLQELLGSQWGEISVVSPRSDIQEAVGRCNREPENGVYNVEF